MTLGVSAMVPTIAVGLAFGNGGYQTFGTKQAAAGSSRLRCRGGTVLALVRLSGGVRLLSAGLVAGAYLATDPCGYDGDAFAGAIRLRRLSWLSPCRPAGRCYCRRRNRGSCCCRRSRSTEIRERGDPALSAEFYAPLLDQLAAHGVAGPIEVVPTRRRGEAAVVASVVPIAKGGRDKLDTGRNLDLLRRHASTPIHYRKWLDDNAISVRGHLERAATTGRRLMRRRWCAAGCRTCKAVWSDRTWTLYAVTNPQRSDLVTGTSYRSRSRFANRVPARAG